MIRAARMLGLGLSLLGCDASEAIPETADAIPDASDAIPDASDAIPDAISDASDAISDAGDAGLPVPWPDPGTAPISDAPLAAEHPAAFARSSRWHARFGPIEGRPAVGFRGAFAVGNGRVFALSGLADPPTTLHNIAGPTYDRADGFFGDQSLSFAEGPFTSATVSQGLSAPIVVHRACRDTLCLDVVDVAHEDCILRVVGVRGGDATVVLAVQPDAEALVDGSGVIERRAGRTLTTRLPGAAHVDAHLRRQMADGERVVTSICAAGEAPHPGLGDVDPGAVLDALAASTAAEAADRVSVSLPDPMVADFIAGVARNLSVQTSTTGAVSPMHRYTRLWLRDSIGPMLAWLGLGEHDRAAALLDALDAGIRRAGDLRNSMPADASPDDAPPAPDYSALPALEGRTGAEGPGYLAWMHWLYWRYTGETARARAALPLLGRAVLAQAFGADDRLPFSGDETFRIALNVALDLPLNHPHEDRSWSANSMALWLGVAPRLAELARALGDDALADAVDARIPEVEAAAAAFFDDDGCLGALIDRETGALSAPFEDASLKPTWTGWLAPDDPRAVANVRCLIDRLGRAPGVLQSPLSPRYVGLPLLAGAPGDGVFTGMQPAYVLAALTAVGHRHAGHAFAALGHALLPDGMPQEYHVRGLDGPFGLSLLYDAGGRDVDQTPKLRPWEAGIALHAVFEHLLGFVPDAPAGAATLAPRLPPGWDRMVWRTLRVGPVRLDATVVRTDGGAAVTVVSDGPLLLTVGEHTQALEPGQAAVFGDR